MTKINNVEFAEAYNEKVIGDFEGLLIPFILYNHLILSKITSDRLKDKADVEELQKINRFKPKE